MNRRGFSLIEMLVVLTIMGVLIAIGTLNFTSWSKKYNREAEIREMLTNLNEAQVNALQQKRRHEVVFEANRYVIRSFESPADTTGRVVLEKNVKGALTREAGLPMTVRFDTLGMSDVGTPQAVCLQDNSADNAVDAVVIAPSKINIAKRQAGEVCRSDKCTLK